MTQANGVQVFKDELRIPTYALTRDDPNPMLGRRLNPYPYTLQNGREAHLTDAVYEAVVVENAYLRLVVLPELGGRLYSATDKRTGRDMFYRNPVIKPRMIGTRGAWFSGGVEFNFPISHAPTTMDRVNCAIREYEDGSAAVVFGGIELMSGMNWKVELKLEPDVARIAQKVTLYNPTPLESRFYFWTNAAVDYSPELELVYPFHWCINHIEPKYVKWPMYDGFDCRCAGSIPYAFETFGKLMEADFFGTYDHAADCGVVHYADRKAVKGAKFFSWGTDDLGDAWNKALTDGCGSGYIEIQSGPFETQAVYKFLPPHRQLSWSESWYPVAGLGGLTFAGKDVAVQYEFQARCVQLRIGSVAAFADCVIRCSINGETYQAVRTLTPERVEALTFDIIAPVDAEPVFELDIVSGETHLLHIDSRRPNEADYADPDLYEDSRVVWTEADERNLYQMAVRYESLGETERAISLYEQNLNVHPYCTLTLNRLGRLRLRSMLAEEAEICFRKTLAYDNRNDEARFLLAAAEKLKGNLRRARTLLMDIASDAGHYDASVLELAKVDIALKRYKEAADHLKSFGPERSAYADLLVRIIRRKTNAAPSAPAPEAAADAFHLAERYITLADEMSKKQLLQFTGCDERILLAVALEYADMRLYAETRQLLDLIAKPGMKSMLLSLHIADETATHAVSLKDVTACELAHVFLNEPLLVQIAACYADRDDSGALDYVLGTFLFAAARKEEAMQRWLRARSKGLAYTALLYSLGYGYFHFYKETDAASRYLRLDIETNGPDNAGTLALLDEIYKQSGNLAERLRLIPLMARTSNRSLILLPMTEIYKDAGLYEEALHLLETEEFENWEGFENSGPCYREVIASLALKCLNEGDTAAAKAWIERIDRYPATLNYGNSARSPQSETHYCKGLVYEACGDTAAARSQYEAGASEHASSGILHTDRSRQFADRCRERLRRNEP